MKPRALISRSALRLSCLLVLAIAGIAGSRAKEVAPNPVLCGELGGVSWSKTLFGAAKLELKLLVSRDNRNARQNSMKLLRLPSLTLAGSALAVAFTLSLVGRAGPESIGDSELIWENGDIRLCWQANYATFRAAVPQASGIG